MKKKKKSTKLPGIYIASASFPKALAAPYISSPQRLSNLKRRSMSPRQRRSSVSVSPHALPKLVDRNETACVFREELVTASSARSDARDRDNLSVSRTARYESDRFRSSFFVRATTTPRGQRRLIFTWRRDSASVISARRLLIFGDPRCALFFTLYRAVWSSLLFLECRGRGACGNRVIRNQVYSVSVFFFHVNYTNYKLEKKTSNYWFYWYCWYIKTYSIEKS